MAKNNESFREQVNLAEQLNQKTRERIELTKELQGQNKIEDSTLRDREKILERIKDNQKDGNKLASIESDIKEKILDYEKKGHNLLADRYKTELKITQIQQKRLNFEGKVDGIIRSQGGILADILNIAEDWQEATRKLDPAMKTVVVRLIVAYGWFKLLSNQAKIVSERIDTIGQSFGAIGVTEFSDGLLHAEAVAMRLGFGMDDVASTINKLSSEFGFTFAEAGNLTNSVLDMSKTLGVSVDEGVELFGIFTKLAGMTSEQAIHLAKSAGQLAVANGVAPVVVMKDIAANTEFFANFAKDGGENILDAAIQAKKLGTELSTIDGVMMGLLDFQTSLTNEIEASMMIGRRLNFQKARELALVGETDAAMENILNQLGTQEEFEKMSVLSKQSLAQAIGVSTAQLSKFIANQDRATELGETLDSLSFKELTGADALSALTQLGNTFKSVAAVLTQTLVPALNIVLTPFAALANFFAENEKAMGFLKGAATVLVPVLSVLAAVAMKTAIASAWAGAMALAGLTGGFGLAGAIVAGTAATAGIISAMNSASSAVPRFENLQSGRTAMVQSGIAIADAGENITRTDDLEKVYGKFEKAQIDTNNRLDKLITAVSLNFGPGSALAREIGKSTGKETVRSLKLSKSGI